MARADKGAMYQLCSLVEFGGFDLETMGRVVSESRLQNLREEFVLAGWHHRRACVKVKCVWAGRWHHQRACVKVK